MGTIWFFRRAQYARRKVVCLRTCTVGRMDAIRFRDVQNTHDVRAYARHRYRVSRQNLVSSASQLVSRQSLVSSERHLVSRRAQYARRKVVCLRTCTVCRMFVSELRDVHSTLDAEM